MDNVFLFVVILMVPLIIIVLITAVNYTQKKQYEQLNKDVLQSLNMQFWPYRTYDMTVTLKSSRAVDDYTHIKFFKDNREMINMAYQV